MTCPLVLNHLIWLESWMILSDSFDSMKHRENHSDYETIFTFHHFEILILGTTGLPV